MEMIIERVETDTNAKKPYQKPEIIHELELETRAGSPYPTPGLRDPLDPFNLFE
jgi:hypothetical protein